MNIILGILNKLRQLYKVVVSALFCLATGLLALLATVYTATVTDDRAEIPYYYRDSIICNLAVILLLVVVFVLLKRSHRVKAFAARIDSDPYLYKKLRRILLVILAIMGLVWACAVQVIPEYDQYMLQNSVYQVVNKNVSSLLCGGYICSYPQQLGQFMICCLFSTIFGTRNYIAYELFNVMALILIAFCLSDLALSLKFSPVSSLLSVATTILFLPLVFYVSFIYGTLIGLALALLSAVGALRFAINTRTFDGILSTVCIILAVMFKSNYLIFAIGIALFLIFDLFDTCKSNPIKLSIKKVLVLIIMLSGCVLINPLLKSCVKSIIPGSMENNVSNLSYVAMGISMDETYLGWYNGYISINLVGTGYDTEAQAQIAKSDIAASLSNIKSDPASTILFFFRKTTTQWCNPTFQGIWINKLCEFSNEPPVWVSWLLNSNGESIITALLNYLMTVIFFGAFLYIPLYKKEKQFTASLILCVIFIGGFIFHMVWEAKAQYTLPYMVLLIPYACASYNRLANLVLNFFKSNL